MEKLIELLNERKGSKLYYAANGSIRMVGEFPISELEIISKKFGFIKWLVENDKIRKDIYRPIPLRIKATYEDGVVYHDKLEDRIIMLLSISDTPIEDLLLYLK